MEGLLLVGWHTHRTRIAARSSPPPPKQAKGRRAFLPAPPRNRLQCCKCADAAISWLRTWENQQNQSLLARVSSRLAAVLHVYELRVPS